MEKLNIKLISNRSTFCSFFFFFFHADVKMYKKSMEPLKIQKFPCKKGTFLDHRVENVLQIMPPWLLQNRALRREENKVEFLQGQFRNEKLSFFHKKGN